MSIYSELLEIAFWHFDEYRPGFTRVEFAAWRAAKSQQGFDFAEMSEQDIRGLFVEFILSNKAELDTGISLGRDMTSLTPSDELVELFKRSRVEVLRSFDEKARGLTFYQLLEEWSNQPFNKR